MLIALVLLPELHFPLFSNRMVDLFSWYKMFSLTSYPCSSIRNLVQRIICARSSAPTSSDSVLSAGELCDLQTGTMHVSSQTDIYGWSTVMDDATALRWSHEDCSTRAHSFDTSHCTQSDWFSLYYITPHLTLDHDQPRFAVWQVMSTSVLLIQSLITAGDHLSRAQR